MSKEEEEDSNEEDDDDPCKKSSRRCNVCAAWECDACPEGGTHQWAYTRPGKQKRESKK